MAQDGPAKASMSAKSWPSTPDRSQHGLVYNRRVDRDDRRISRNGSGKRLNQVELWFGKIERDVIARGVSTSVSHLKRKLMRYIRFYNKAPWTMKWKYADPSRHISTQSVGTGH